MTPSINPLFREPLLWIFLITLTALGMTAALILQLSLFLPLFLVATILAILLLFRAPIILLFSLIIVRMSLDYSSQFFSVTLYNISLSLSQLLGLSIALLGIMVFILKRKNLIDFPLNTSFFILFLWGGATLFYSLYPKTSLQELLRIFDLFTLGFLAYATIKTTKDFKHLLQAFFASSILPILFGLYQFVFHIGLQDENVSVLRIFGTFSHPNVYSVYLFSLVVFGCLYFILFAEYGWRRLTMLFVLGAFIAMLLLTFARVAWVALFLFTFLISLFRYRYLLIPLFLIPFVLFTYSQTFQNRVNESLTINPDSSIVWRQTLWHDVIIHSLQDDRLWFGSGIDTFPKVSESVRGTTNGPNDPHNDFVKFFIEGGVVGLALFIVYLLSLFTLLVRKYRASRKGNALKLAFGFMILFFITLELSALTDNIFKNTPVQWLFFTALGALLSLSEQKENTPLG